MSRKVLTESHPHRQKFDKLIELAEKENIKIDFYGSRTLIIIEEEEYYLEDMESSLEPMNTFPPLFGYHLRVDKD